jgi:hypothetical protein
MEGFYLTVAGFCFTLMGLWSGVVQLRRKEWLFDLTRRRMVHSVFLSFLLPAVMSLIAAAVPDVRLVWQVAFFSAGLFGLITTVFFIARPSTPEYTWFIRRARPLVAFLYALIAFTALFPDILASVGITLKPIQVEAIILAVLVFLGVATAWDFSMEPTTEESLR